VVWVLVKASEAVVANTANVSTVNIWVAAILEEQRMKMSGFVSSFVDADSNNKNEEINEAKRKCFGRKMQTFVLLYVACGLCVARVRLFW
jgi:hypothetical protein